MKKGEITTEFLIKLVIAVFSIVILVYVGYKVSHILLQRNELEQAKESLNKINSVIEKVQQDGKERELFINSPNRWWVLAWPYGSWKSSEGKTKPSNCQGDYCVCVCPIDFLSGVPVSTKENSLLLCESRGVCKDFKQPLKTISEVPVKGLFAKTVKFIARIFGNVKNIPLVINGVQKLKVSLNKNEIIITQLEIK